MTDWQYHIKGLRELISGTDDVQTDMGAVAAFIINNDVFSDFTPTISLIEWIYIDEEVAAAELLDEMWNYCDDNLIWID